MLKRLIVVAAALLIGIWLFVHWQRVTGDADAVIRFSLGIFFAVLVMLRRKKPDAAWRSFPAPMVPLALGAATLAAILGIVFRVHMLEWLGVLALLATCLVWVLPIRFRQDVLIASGILFWVHPLPGQIFGWLQGSMQRLSVMGSELVLHALNVRVWGDGIVLRTGYQNFLVPEACSGMRTSVTVFLCALGVGLLLRLKWFETVFFVLLGLLQVLLLNITRISFMVVWAPRMPPEWAENFLHDSLGIFLMVGIVLIQLEAGWWYWWSRRRAFLREAVKRREIEAPERASIVPHALRRLVWVTVVMAGVAFILLGAFALVYKSRSFHRKEMIREVAEGLLDQDPATADRALRTIRQGFPEDRDLLSLHANAKLLQGSFEEALALLTDLQEAGHTLSLQEKIMQAWSLSRVGRLAEARRVVQSLESGSERIPGVAMLHAEFAAMDGVPGEVSRHIVHAATSYRLLPRIRSLFPFLARHEQWEAISRADPDRPYREFLHAQIAMHAHQQMNNLSGLMQSMRQTLASWPSDPRLLSTLFDLAIRQQGGEWEEAFESNLRANLTNSGVDALSAAARYCWGLSRPDLAWLVYARMAQIAPSDPELLVAPVRFGTGWTEVRRHRIGVAADDARSRIDLVPLLQVLQGLEPFQGVYNRIPLLDEVLALKQGGNPQPYLEAGLAEIRVRRKREEPLGMRLIRLEPMLLAMLGRYDEAHAALDRILQAFPAEEAAVLVQHARFYEQQQQWANSYEALYQRQKLDANENLTVDLLMIGSLMNMNMGMAAMEHIREARQRYPGALRLDLAESAIWDVFGFKAQALHVLQQTSAGTGSAVAAELYEKTGRLEEARQLRSSLGLTRRLSGRVVSPLWLEPAEWAVTPRWPEPPAPEEIRAELSVLREQQVQAQASAFVRELRGLQIAWYERLLTGAYAAADPGRYDAILARWRAVGRTDRERATAMYQLAMYAARQKDQDLALHALRQTTTLVPQSAVVWRARLALEGREPGVVEAARAAVPHDPAVFLGALVVGLEQHEGEQAQALIARMRSFALAETHFPVETLIRAGSHILAQGWAEETIPLAEAVAERAGSLLAGHVFVMRAAMMNRRSDWALAATLRAIELARDKTPFYKTLVDLKIARRETDSDLLVALEYLQSREPDDTRWSEALGSLYFERGDLQRALTIFGSVIDEDIRGVQVRSLLLAAESARLQNRLERAVRILESAHALQPEQPAILNNLIYMLAQNPDTLPRARALLPRLLALDAESFSVLDTAAQVAMRSGDLDQAEEWIQQALDSINMDAYGAHEVRLNWAELLMRRGRLQEARKLLQALRQDARRPDFVDQRTRRLLRDLDEAGP